MVRRFSGRSLWLATIAAIAALTLAAYSTPREAYEEIIPLFQATPEGANVQFETSFAASGVRRSSNSCARSCSGSAARR